MFSNSAFYGFCQLLPFERFKDGGTNSPVVRLLQFYSGGGERVTAWLSLMRVGRAEIPGGVV
jgi:hypothetical protein